MSTGRDFWSRRRAGVEAEAEALQARAAEVEAEALEERPDEDILAELNLAMPEELETPDAVQEFLRSAVPQRLKNRALRRLWRLNPMLANLDGLVDYGEDYTDAATVVENLQTAYQVGKGMLTALVEDDEDPTAEEDEPLAEDDDQSDALTAAAEEESHMPVEVTPAEIEPEPIPVAMPQRRMRFDFADA